MAAAVLGMTVSLPSFAQTRAERTLEWEGPATCPSAEEVRGRVHQLLGADAPKSASVRLAAAGVVTLADGQYHLTLTIRLAGHPTDTRNFDSPSCESLAGAAAVMLALLIRGEVGKTPEPVAPPKPPLAGVPAGPTEPPKKEEPNAPPKPRGWAILLDTPAVAFDAGVMPSAAYGITVGAGAQVGDYQVLLSGGMWLDQLGSSGASRSNFSRYAGGVAGCRGFRVWNVNFGPCVLVRFEHMSARGGGQDIVAKSGEATWFDLGAGLRSRLFLSRWAALVVEPSLMIATSHPSFTIDGVGTIHRVAFGSAGAMLGWEWIF